MAELGMLYMILVILAIIVAILWIMLPFAVFGTKPRIDKLIDEIRLTNKLLSEIATRLKV